MKKAADKALIAGIAVYRAALRPFMGPCCRFEPSCSQYAKEAIDHWGALKGSGLALLRLLKCHPLHAGGFDPVPAVPEK